MSSFHAAVDVDHLPLEIWRLVLDYLPPETLCLCVLVNRTWRDLVYSLDRVTWKRLCLQLMSYWPQPAWPFPFQAPSSWRRLCLERAALRRLWRGKPQHAGKKNNAAGLNTSHSSIKTDFISTTSCLTLGRSKPHKRQIRAYATPQAGQLSLREALNLMRPHDTVLLAPGIYQEDVIEFSPNQPYELVGDGPPSSIRVCIVIDHSGTSGRLANLTFVAPWFTVCPLRVTSGFLQLDNCILVGGAELYATHPACIVLRFCSLLEDSCLRLRRAATCLVEHCLFDGTNVDLVTLDGEPKCNRCWAAKQLQLWLAERLPQQMSKSTKRKQNEQQKEMRSRSASNLTASEKSEGYRSSEVGVSSNSSTCKKSSFVRGSSAPSFCLYQNEPQEEKQSTASLKGDAVSTINEENNKVKEEVDGDWEKSTSSRFCQLQPGLLRNAAGGAGNDSGLLNVRLLHEPCPSFMQSMLEAKEKNDYRMFHEELTKSFGLKFKPYHLMREREVVCLIESLRGPLLWRCIFRNAKGGVLLNTSSHAAIVECEFQNLQYGVKCVNSARCLVYRCLLHHCTLSAIFVRVHAQAVLACNEIHSTSEAGIDIRKMAHPYIMFNRIHHCYRSGIVCMAEGGGIIKHNDIHFCSEAGIYILYCAQPMVIANNIMYGKASGIAIMERGGGTITDNFIAFNQWSGIDIRKRAHPYVARNFICGGNSDGVVIGEGGSGVILFNVICANLGCGLWLKSPAAPLIHGNQIGYNGSHGVGFQTESACSGTGSDTESIHLTPNLLLPPGALDTEYDRADDARDDLMILRNCGRLATLEYNSIYCNGGSGFNAVEADFVVFKCNAIHANVVHGVHLRLAGGVPERLLCRLESNLVTNNGACGLSAGIASLPGQLDITGNGFYDNMEHGALLQVDTMAFNNDFVGNHASAVTSEGKVHLRLQSCRLHCATAPPLQLLSEEIRGELRNNIFLYAEVAPKNDEPVKASVATRAALTMEGNKVTQVVVSQVNDLPPVSRNFTHWRPSDPTPRPTLPSNVRPPPLPRRPLSADLAERQFRNNNSNFFYCGTSNDRFSSAFCLLL